jgi:hypothetical protein
VFRLTGVLYGVISSQNPDAYTGAWKEEVDRKRVTVIPVEAARKVPGAILLRRIGKAGHIVFSDGKGGTIEAMNKANGVCRGKSSNRLWTHGILLPEVSYV